MARKAEPGIKYYSMECDHMGNSKVKLLINNCGDTGYKVWQFLLSYGYKKWGYYFDMNDADELELFATDNCRVKVDELETIIECCVAKKLFDKAIYEEYKILTSVHMQEVYIEATANRRSAKGTIITLYREYLLLDPEPEKDTIAIRSLDGAQDDSEPPKAKIVLRQADDDKKEAPKKTKATNVKNEHYAAWGKVEKKGTAIMEYIKTSRPTIIEPYVEFWNIWAVSNGRKKNKVRDITPLRRNHFSARIKETNWDFLECLQVASRSQLCMANNWFDFDFLIKNTDGYLKLLERKYDNAIVELTAANNKTEPAEPINPSFHKMEQMLNQSLKP